LAGGDTKLPEALGAADVATLVFIVWVWVTVFRVDSAATARIARAEDASRPAAEAVLLAVGAASLVAVEERIAMATRRATEPATLKH